MIKLTVMYTLPAGADHDEYMKWRTTEHQRDNMAIPGLIKSDFYVVRRGFPGPVPSYSYITEAYWPDMATFEKSFFDPDYQVALAESLKRTADPLFLISEEVMSEMAG